MNAIWMQTLVVLVAISLFFSIHSAQQTYTHMIQPSSRLRTSPLSQELPSMTNPRPERLLYWCSMRPYIMIIA
jgi:hypothetical protein